MVRTPPKTNRPGTLEAKGITPSDEFVDIYAYMDSDYAKLF